MPLARRLGFVRILASFALCSTGGCGLDHLKTRDRLEKGLVIVLPGIEGRSIWNTNLAAGLADGGVDCAIVLYEWGTPVPGGFLINLTDHSRNRAEAQKLADYVRSYQDSFPSRQVHLVGHSGGAGMALMAVELLPDDCLVESLTLLAAAVSPTYDLRPALRSTRWHLYNCYSARDSLLLGLGTTIAGTIDREHGKSAGMTGFRVPDHLAPADRAILSKLRQREWHPELNRLGNDGSHMGWTNREFVRDWIAPVIGRMLREQMSKGSDFRVSIEDCEHGTGILEPRRRSTIALAELSSGLPRSGREIAFPLRSRGAVCTAHTPSDSQADSRINGNRSPTVTAPIRSRLRLGGTDREQAIAHLD